MTLSFRAHCERDHDRIDFTDPKAFEAHMTGEHGAKKRHPGTGQGATPSGKNGKPAPGWSGGKPAAPHPHKAPPAPRDTRKLTAVLVKWQDEPWPTPKRWWGATGPSHVIGADWETDESSPRTWHDEATA